jgi:hypothetical protein
MTDYKDYKHFPRVIRHTQGPDYCGLMIRVALFMALVLGALSFAGKEDQAAQSIIDRAQVQERPQMVYGAAH